jgi:hypothetical protein
MARRTAAQLARRRQVERVIALMAPMLDLVLRGGEQISRVAGRNELPPEPPRHPTLPPAPARRSPP